MCPAGSQTVWRSGLERQYQAQLPVLLVLSLCRCQQRLCDRRAWLGAQEGVCEQPVLLQAGRAQRSRHLPSEPPCVGGLWPWKAQGQAVSHGRVCCRFSTQAEVRWIAHSTHMEGLATDRKSSRIPVHKEPCSPAVHVVLDHTALVRRAHVGVCIASAVATLTREGFH